MQFQKKKTLLEQMQGTVTQLFRHPENSFNSVSF